MTVPVMSSSTVPVESLAKLLSHKSPVPIFKVGLDWIVQSVTNATEIAALVPNEMIVVLILPEVTGPI